MSHLSKKERTPAIVYAFMGAGIGAVFGLLCYVKDWL